MYVKHLGADMRLHRARQLLDRLAGAEDDYLGGGSLRLERSEVDGSTRLRIGTPLPAELPALAGQVVHACREALDDLALSLVVASRRAPRSTTFPIAADVHAYPELERRCLRHANPVARGAVRSVTPWKGGDDLLWDLHELDAAGGLLVALGHMVELGPTRVPSPLGVLQPAAGHSRACRALSDGSLLAAPESPVQLVVTYGDPTCTRPLLPLLRRLIAHVTGVVDRVVKAAEHSA